MLMLSALTRLRLALLAPKVEPEDHCRTKSFLVLLSLASSWENVLSQSGLLQIPLTSCTKHTGVGLSSTGLWKDTVGL